jgi:hypothetical protein
VNAATTTEAKEATMSTTTTFRTFESFDIRWNRGSTWTNFDTAAEAQAIIDSSVARGDDGGEVVRKSFEIELDPRFVARGMYQPGVSDRVVTA